MKDDRLEKAAAGSGLLQHTNGHADEQEGGDHSQRATDTLQAKKTTKTITKTISMTLTARVEAYSMAIPVSLLQNVGDLHEFVSLLSSRGMKHY